MDEGEMAASELVEAGEHPRELLDQADHDLDLGALLVQPPIRGAVAGATGVWRDHRRTALGHPGEDAPIPEHGAGRKAAEQDQGLWRTARLAGGQGQELPRCRRMCTARSRHRPMTARAPDLLPPFCPAAEVWGLVEGGVMVQLRGRLGGVPGRRAERRRRQPVEPDPGRAGVGRWGVPVSDITVPALGPPARRMMYARSTAPRAGRFRSHALCADRSRALW